MDGNQLTINELGKEALGLCCSSPALALDCSMQRQLFYFDAIFKTLIYAFWRLERGHIIA